MTDFGPAVALLTLAYVAVAALLLNLNLATRHSRTVKVTGIVLVTALYVGTWHGHKGLLGWASDDALPERFRLHYATVEEANKAGRTPGTIYLWISALDGPAERRAPRAYRITWDADTARAVLDALAEVERGVEVEGRRVQDGTMGRVHPVEPAAAGSPPPRIEFRAVPTPRLPPKF